MPNPPLPIAPSDHGASGPSRTVLKFRWDKPTKASSLDVRGLQTTMPPPFNPGKTPPLLPALLITGVLLAIIVALTLWRHISERRRQRRMGEGGGAELIWGETEREADLGPAPTLWEVEVEKKTVVGAKDWDWKKIMPASLKPLYAPPMPKGPRYLVPREKPREPYWRRMMGGAFGEYGLFSSRRDWNAEFLSRPEVSRTAPSTGVTTMDDEAVEGEEQIDRFEVAVFIAYPKPRRRHGTHEKDRKYGDLDEKDENNEKAAVHDSHDSDDEGPTEFSLGTLTVPYAGET